MTAVSFADEEEYLHPVPAWRFFLTLPSLPGLADEGTILTILAQKFVATHRGVDYEQVPFNAGIRNFPTAHHADAIAATFVDNHRFSAYAYIDAWISLVVDRNGVFGMPATYKRPIVVQALGVSGDAIATFGYSYCSPVKPDPHDFDGSATGYLTTSTQFVTDGELEPQFINSIVSSAS